MRLALLLALSLAHADPTPEHRVRLEVIAEAPRPGMRVVAVGRWLGKDLSTQLTSQPDGTWTAEWTGRPARALPLRLLVETDQLPLTEAWRGTATLTVPDDQLSWRLDLSGPRPVARRAASPMAGGAVVGEGRLRLLGAGIWGLLAVNLVGWLVLAHRRDPETS